jgi:hypothetical protein
METWRESEMSNDEGKRGATRAVRNLGRVTRWGFKLAHGTASWFWGLALDVWYWVVNVLMDLITG